MRKILLVDDSPDFLKLFGDFLSSKGYHVSKARDPIALAAQMSEGIPDLVVMDIQMPAGGAETAHKMLVNDPKFAKTPILFCSGLSLQEMKEKFPESPLRRHVHKPVDLKEFHRLVSEMLASD